jgi:succinoglycan biosynthesis transport protein ExoP
LVFRTFSTAFSTVRGSGELEQDASLTLRDYLRIAARRKWIIILCALLAPASAVAVSLQQEKLYQASADVLLSRQNLAAALTNTDDPLAAQDPERHAETQVNVARVPRVLSQALAGAGVSDRGPDDLLERSNVSAKPSADILVFRVTDPDRRLAIRLATAYAEAFTRYRRTLDTASLKLARREAEAELAELQAAGEARSELYANLVEKERELRTLEALQTSNANLLRPARRAEQVQPRPLRNGLIGLALGVLLGIGFALLRDALDTRVRSVDEIAGALDLPLLGRIAEPSRRIRRKGGLVMREEPASSLAEAFRMLRTNVEFANVTRGARLIMVTSAVEGEGKSTTAANLAFAFARQGKRVALVELDLRRPSLARIVGLDGGPGITDAAVHWTSVDEAIAHVTLSNGHGPPPNGSTNGHGSVAGKLDVLVAGSLPPNPGEFVGTRGVKDVLRELRERYDLVLIDSPPLLHVGDARALAAEVDAVLLVVRLHIARKQYLAELRRALEAVPAQPLGFVLAGAELEEGYGYESYAYYGSKQPAKPAAAGARRAAELRDV